MVRCRHPVDSNTGLDVCGKDPCYEHERKVVPTDMVNSPPHYTGVVVRGKRHKVEDDRYFSDGSVRASIEIEAIDIIEALGLGYHLGTVLKYLWRAGKKGSEIEDLKKARWFLDRKIDRMENEGKHSKIREQSRIEREISRAVEDAK